MLVLDAVNLSRIEYLFKTNKNQTLYKVKLPADFRQSVRQSVFCKAPVFINRNKAVFVSRVLMCVYFSWNGLILIKTVIVKAA